MTDRHELLPAGLPLGRGHGLVPDRGRRARGRPRRERLGPLLARRPARSANGDTGEVACDFYHRYPRRHRADDASSGSTRSASRSPGRASCRQGRGAVNEAGLDFYDRLVDDAARARDRAVRDALPLGHAAGARGRGRLAGARDRRGVRRVRRGRRRAARRPRAALDRRTTSRGSTRGSATRGASTRRAGRARPTRSRPRTTCCSRTAGRSQAIRARRARRAGRHRRSTSRTPTRRPTRPRTRRPRGRSTARATAGSSTRSSAARIRPTCSSATSSSRRSSATATSRRSPRRSTSSASTTTSASSSRAGAERAADGQRPRGAAHRHGLGGLPGRPARSCSCGSPTTTRRRRSTSPRTAPPSATCAATTAASTTRSGRVPRGLHRRGRPRGRGRRARQGLLRLEPARQLRVGVRLLEAVRDRLRRLPDARARAEGQLLLVPRLHREPARRAAAVADRG